MIIKTRAFLLNGNCDITQQLITLLIKWFRDQLWNARLSAARCCVSAWFRWGIQQCDRLSSSLSTLFFFFLPPLLPALSRLPRGHLTLTCPLSSSLPLPPQTRAHAGSDEGGKWATRRTERLFYSWRGFCVKQRRGRVPSKYHRSGGSSSPECLYCLLTAISHWISSQTYWWTHVLNFLVTANIEFSRSHVAMGDSR